MQLVLTNQWKRQLSKCAFVISNVMRSQPVGYLQQDQSQSFLDDPLDRPGECVNFFTGCIDVRSDAHAAEFGVDDGRRNDPVFFHEVSANCIYVNARKTEIRKTTRLTRVVWRQDLYPFLSIEPPRPAIEQEPKPSRLTLRTDSFMEIQGLNDRIVICGRMCADFFEFPDVRILLFFRGH